MKVKFKDGNIVDAIRYTTEVYESGELVHFITSLIRKAHPSADDILFTEMHDRAIDITWRVGNNTAAVLLHVADWCYYNPKDNNLWGISGDLFANHFLEKMPGEEFKTTTIQEDILALEKKISEHLKSIGAISGEFMVAYKPIKFLASYSIDYNDLSEELKRKSASEFFEELNSAPWKFQPYIKGL